MARPNVLPFWATQDEIDPLFGTPNKAVPSTEKQDFGQRGQQNTLRQDINYLFNAIREWLQFFNEQYEVDDVYWLVDAGQTVGTLENSISVQLGGTWEFIDGGSSDPTGTFAGQDVYVFKKISEVNV